MKFCIQKSMLNYTAIIIQAHSISEMSNHHRQPKDFNSKKCLQTNLSHWTPAPRSETFNRFVCQTRKSFAEKKNTPWNNLDDSSCALVINNLTESIEKSYSHSSRFSYAKKTFFVCKSQFSLLKYKNEYPIQRWQRQKRTRIALRRRIP